MSYLLITGLHLSHHVCHVALQQVCHAGVKAKNGRGLCVPGGLSLQRQNEYECVCVPSMAEAEEVRSKWIVSVKSWGLQQNVFSCRNHVSRGSTRRPCAGGKLMCGPQGQTDLFTTVCVGKW